jgi:hypothetical protein
MRVVQCFRTKQQAVCATVPNTPPTITAANSDVRRRVAARCAGCAGPARRAKRWLRRDETVAWRGIVSSETASLASARTGACPGARWMTDSSQESSRFSAIRIPASQMSGWNHKAHNATSRAGGSNCRVSLRAPLHEAAQRSILAGRVVDRPARSKIHG